MKQMYGLIARLSGVEFRADRATPDVNSFSAPSPIQWLSPVPCHIAVHDRIMMSSILNWEIACTACGRLAGIRIASPALS